MQTKYQIFDIIYKHELLNDIIVSVILVSESDFENKMNTLFIKIKKEGIGKEEGKLLAQDELQRATDGLNAARILHENRFFALCLFSAYCLLLTVYHLLFTYSS